MARLLQLYGLELELKSKTMKRTVYAVRFVSHGLYEWGKGFISNEKYELWEEFWSNCPSSTWKAVKGDYETSCELLVSMAGSIYLHPMDFDAIITMSDVSLTDVYLRDLNKVLKKCAEYVGFTFDLYVSKKQRIDFGEYFPYMD